MKVIDILIDSALFLGLTDEAEVLKTTNEENVSTVLADYKQIVSLLNLSNFAIRELCTNYIPIVKDICVKTKDKTFALNTLENYIRIQQIQKNGESVKFKIINRNVNLDEDGEYVVLYETYPTIISLFDEIDFLNSFNPDIIVFGLCAYYSLANGMFDDFQNYHEKYISRAESLKSLKSFDLPARRWE